MQISTPTRCRKCARHVGIIIIHVYRRSGARSRVKILPDESQQKTVYTSRENIEDWASRGCSACAPLGVRAWTAEGRGSRGRAGRRRVGAARGAGRSGARAPSDRWRPAPSVKRVCIMNATDQSDRDRGDTFIFPILFALNFQSNWSNHR